MPTQRSAFTLVEMIIVLLIVGVLAALAVNTYADGRKRARFEIAVDSIMSVLSEQIQKVKSGRPFAPLDGPGSSLQSGCFGLVFRTQKNGDAPMVSPLMLPYFSARGTDADFCDQQLSQTALQASFQDIEIRRLALDGQQYEELQVIAKPPFGKLFATSDGTIVNDAQKMLIVIGLKNIVDERCFEIDLRTQLQTKLLPATCSSSSL